MRTMSQPKNEFTNVTSLRAEALGEPGKRTFRILANNEESSAIIGLEKEELLQLGLAIRQILGTLDEELKGSGSLPLDREAPQHTHLDFKVNRLVLSHDGSSGLFVVDAHDIEDEEEEPATVRLWANLELVKEFSEEALRVCAAGRPLCPLCGGPIDPTGHQCPRVNGQVKISDL